MEKGEVETSMHFLRHSLAFTKLKLKHLVNYTFGEPWDIADTGISRLNKFVMGLKRFVDLWRSFSSII